MHEYPYMELHLNNGISVTVYGVPSTKVLENAKGGGRVNVRVYSLLVGLN